MERTILPLDVLKEAPYNPRRMSDDDRQRLRRSLQEFGQVQDLVVNIHSGDHIVVGGNQRLIVMRELGWTEAKVTLVDLDPVKEKALNLALNKIGGEFDRSLLTNILADLLNSSIDIDLTGFTSEEVDGMLKDLKPIEPDFGDLTIPGESTTEKEKLTVTIKCTDKLELETVTTLLTDHQIVFVVK